MNPRLALYTAVAMPPIAVLALRFARLVTPMSREVQQRKGDVTESADEAVVGIEMVQAFGREEDVHDRFGEQGRGGARHGAAAGGSRGALPPGLYYLPSLSIAAVVSSAAAQVIGGDLTLGEFASSTTLLLQLVLAARGARLDHQPRAARPRLGGPQLRVARGDPAGARAERPRAAPRGRARGPLRAGVASPTAASTRCSRESTSVEPGEIVAVCGGTGSGKTTLLNLLAALLRPERRAAC